MSTLALYRQWRPRTFEDVVGQDAIITTLRNQIAAGRISHAYLFCGSRGTGKTTTAKIFARAVGCLSPRGGDPCGECEACCASAAEDSMDIIEIDAASNNGVDEIRDLREKIKYPPQKGRYRVYIIDEVHMLSTGAFNALLKTLEEPPAHALFILATTEPQRLPSTVLSRVQRYDFRRLTVQIIVNRLREIVKGENGDVTDAALGLIARSAEGGMRDAISLLDMALSYGGGSVDEALVREVLGAADRGFLFDFAESLLSGDAGAALRAVDSLSRAGHEVQVFVRDVTGHLRALLLAQTTGDALKDLLETTEEDAAAYRRQAEAVDRARLLSLLDLFIALEADMRWSNQPRTALEVAAVRACMPRDEVRLDTLSARIDLLEKRVETGVAAPTSSAAASSKTAQRPVPPTPLASAPSGAAPDAPAPSPAPRDGAQEDQDEDTIWQKVLVEFRKEPLLMANVMQGKFGGIHEGAAILRYEKTGEIFVNMLRQEERRQRIEAILTEAAGRPLTLRLEVQGEKASADTKGGDPVQQVIDLFGRQSVQVVSDADDPPTEP